LSEYSYQLEYFTHDPGRFNETVSRAEKRGFYYFFSATAPRYLPATPSMSIGAYEGVRRKVEVDENTYAVFDAPEACNNNVHAVGEQGETRSVKSDSSKKKSPKIKPIAIHGISEWLVILNSSEQNIMGQSPASVVNSSNRASAPPVIGDFLGHVVRRDCFLEQLGNSLRNGALSKSSAATRRRVLNMLDRHWRDLCAGVENNRVRMIYETVRDYTAQYMCDDAREFIQLSSSALLCLSKMIVALNMPQRDPRLVRFHIDRLYKMMNEEVTLIPAYLKTKRHYEGVNDSGASVISASKCLCLLECEFPTLLSHQASELVADAMESERNTALVGFPKTSLALTVLANLCMEYQKQEGSLRDDSDMQGLLPSSDDEQADEVISNADVFPDMAERRMAVHAGVSAVKCSGFDSPVNVSSSKALGKHDSNVSSDTVTTSSTPRSAFTGDIVLLREPAEKLKFHLPEHFWAGTVPFYEVDLIMSEYSRKKIQELFLFCLDCMKRMNRETVQRISPSLQIILRVSDLSPSDLWPIVHSLIQTGNTPILEFVLDTHDCLPEFFEGRRPCLLEKILVRANDKTFSAEHRQLCLRWILRQHAVQCHEGLPILLSDCWMQLLMDDDEAIEIASLKIKALAACMKSGIGDPEVIMQSVCLWPGFANAALVNQFSYALRLLYKSLTVEGSGDVDIKREASLIRSLVHVAVVRPQVVRAINDFLDTCEEEFSVHFLTGYQALISSLDGQFDVLRHRAEDKKKKKEAHGAHLSSRIKASVLSRASSVSGMVRGLSFKLGRGSNPYSYRSSIFDSSSNMSFSHSRVNSVASARSIATTDQHSFVENRDADVASLLSAQDACVEDDVQETMAAEIIPCLSTTAELNEWLVAPSTWEYLKRPMLRQDLMAYRSLSHKVLRTKEICPSGALRSISNYTWQYDSYHPSHCLTTKDNGNAILALVQTAALVHLPMMNEANERSYEQYEVADSILEVLDALQEGFPCPSTCKRARVLMRLVNDVEAWTQERSSATLASILGGYIDAALQL